MLEAPLVELKEDLLFDVQPVGIVDQRMKEKRKKVIPMVKVLWQNDTVEEMTWKMERSMQSRYSYLFLEE